MSSWRAARSVRHLRPWRRLVAALALALAASRGGTLSAQSRPPEARADLRAAVQAWVAVQRDAYRRGDVAAFQPCPEPRAVVLRDIDGATHACADVQAHMRDRMGGDLAITVDSIRARGDSGFVYNTMHFRRSVTRGGVVQQREAVAVHRDLWRRRDGAWRHVEMVEIAPQQLYVDGRPASPASSVEAVILAIDDTINAVRLRHDTLTLARLFADDVSGVTARGQVIGKRDILNAAAHTDETHTDVDERHVRVLGDAGDVAVVTCRVTDSGTHANGESFTTRTRVTTVYVRRGATWQVVAVHTTLIPPP